jgi:hypothetical protein
MLYTKNGSIPQPETDGTDGWIEAADKPECPEGKEVVWLNWEWVVRDPKPQDREGYQWNWNHGEMAWVEGTWGISQVAETLSEPVESLTTDQLQELATDQIQVLTTTQIASLY